MVLPPRGLRRVAASLDKPLYDNILCLVASNYEQFNWEEAKEATGKTWKSATPKRVRIRSKYCATVAFVSGG